jgi:hypothetical protein
LAVLWVGLWAWNLAGERVVSWAARTVGQSGVWMAGAKVVP